MICVVLYWPVSGLTDLFLSPSQTQKSIQWQRIKMSSSLVCVTVAGAALLKITKNGGFLHLPV
jgi:hypothetical protein